MTIVLDRPRIDGLARVVDDLRGWQFDGGPAQLHPGDIGWHWRFGAAATAGALRTWRRDGRVLAVGLLDGPDLLRLAIAPEAQDDQELAHQLVADVTAPRRGVLPPGEVHVEARGGAWFRTLLTQSGWEAGEPWTPLSRDLAEPVPDCGVRIEVIGAGRAHVRAAVQRAAFDGSTFTDERWHAMAAGPPYVDARCLVAYDANQSAVAAVTVWSAGPGRPGLLEPMGVHREHRGHGYGTAITLAAAAMLRSIGSSSATVCAETSNAGAVATYVSAGYERHAPVCDLRRNA